jgi:cell division protease FtsH
MRYNQEKSNQKSRAKRRMHPIQDDRRPEQEPKSPSPQSNWQRYAIIIALALALLFILFANMNNFDSASGDAPEISFSDLRANYSNLRVINFGANEITNAIVELRGEFNSPVELTVAGERVDVLRFSAYARDWQAEELYNTILAYNQENPAIEMLTSPPPPQVLGALFAWLPIIFIILISVFFFRRTQGQMNGVFSFGQSRAREYNAQMPRVTFDDVAGQDAAKRELVEVVDFLKEPEKYISLGARIPRGVLLVGPPGTGKTLMARAVAGEANVAFYSIAASEFVEMFVGVGASRVRDLFKKAKENSPSIVFIDEIDAVGRQRGAGLGGGNDEREQTLNQMLAELDGFDQSSTVIVMAATNRPDVLDPALLRPGRFDRQVTVDLPDKKGRLAILKIHTRGKPLTNDVDLDVLASATIGFSGADLSNLCNEAALHAARHNRKKITQADFSNAFERIILGIERPPLSDAREREVVAYHEAGHTVAALLTPGADQVLKVTITPRGYAGGVTWSIRGETAMSLRPRSFFEADIRMGLGGRAAEQVIFGEATPGAAGDIRQVTQTARRMVTQWGMSSLGMVDYSNGGDQPFLGYALSQGRQYSEETAAQIDVEVRRIIDEAYEDVLQLLKENRSKLDDIAKALLEREILERNEILEIMGLSVDKPIDNPEEILPETPHLPVEILEKQPPTEPDNRPGQQQ